MHPDALAAAEARQIKETYDKLICLQARRLQSTCVTCVSFAADSTFCAAELSVILAPAAYQSGT